MTQIFGWFFFLKFLIGFQLVTAEIFSSMADMQSLISTEQELLNLLKNLRDTEVQKLTATRKYVQKLRRESKLEQNHETKSAENIFSQPISAFQFIKHHTVDWQDLKNILNLNPTKDSFDALKMLRSSRPFPNDEDIKGSAEAFQRLQATYKIQPEEIADGRIALTRRTPSFTSRECFLVGYRQADAGFFGSAIPWLEIALKKFHEEPEKTIERNLEILDWLQFSVFHFNQNVSRSLQISELIKEIQPNFPNVDANLKHYRQHLANLSDEEKAKLDSPAPPYSEPTQEDEYETLCRGERQIAPRVLPHLRCYLETYKNPFLLLQPVKTEVVHVDPDVFVFHDVLLSSQMTQIREVGQERLKRAQIISGSKTGVSSKSRISKTAFLEESVHPVIQQINLRSGHVTNLNVLQSEFLQVNNYGIGGHYLPHYDYFNDPEKKGSHLIEKNLGDRIATFLIYMTNVEAGGATVFPRLNLTLFPEKGSAAFWFNLFKDGQGDIRTLHSGCPVLSGNKWVSNKWFREVQQDVTRPCGLERDSPQIE